MANQYLSLALFLMLLSFFIVMNASSNYEQSKSHPVMKSVVLAFTGKLEQEVVDYDEPIMPEMDFAAVQKSGDTLSALEGLFNAHLEGFDVTRNKLGTVMRVRTSVAQFKKAINMLEVDYLAVGTGERGSFAKTMVALLHSEQGGQPYRMDMVLHVDADPSVLQRDMPDRFFDQLRQVSDFSQKLEGFGLPPKMMSAGLSKGEVGFIDLYFYRYEPFDMMVYVRQNQEEGAVQ